MSKSLLILGTLLLNIVGRVAAQHPMEYEDDDSDYMDLVPARVTRSIASESNQKRGFGKSAYELKNNGQFFWLSPDDASSEVAVSLDMQAQTNETILDLEEFQDEIEFVSCTNPMTLRFRDADDYQIAIEAWEWVNEDPDRSFILVESAEACGKRGRRRPWRATDMYVQKESLTIQLQLTPKTWKEVLADYALKWGDESPLPLERRFGLPTIGKEFGFDFTVAHEFPAQIFSTSTGKVGIDLVCNGCGTKGSVAFSGEVHGTLTGLKKASVTVRPKGVQAAVNLGMKLSADSSAIGLPAFSKHWTLATIPIPNAGFRIPNILTIGPNVQINAGFELDSIRAVAMISSGVTATIPDDSVASIDLLSKRKLDVSGWKPIFDFNPLTTSAEIDATAEFFVEAAAAISLLILDDTGFNVDVGLRVPDISVTAKTVHNSKGVCEGSKSTLGVTLDASIGAALVLEGYTALDGDEKLFLDLDLFRVPKSFTLPQGCVGLDSGIPDTDPAPKPERPDPTQAGKPKKSQKEKDVDSPKETKEAEKSKPPTPVEPEPPKTSKVTEKPEPPKTSKATDQPEPTKTSETNARKPSPSGDDISETSKGSKKTSPSKTGDDPEPTGPSDTTGEGKTATSTDSTSTEKEPEGEKPTDKPDPTVPPKPSDQTDVSPPTNKPRPTSDHSDSTDEPKPAETGSESKSATITISTKITLPTETDNFKICKYYQPEAVDDGDRRGRSPGSLPSPRPSGSQPLKRSSPTDKEYRIGCDSAEALPLVGWSYPGPKSAVRKIPIIKMLVGCDANEVCPPSKWGVEVSNDATLVAERDHIYASEHVYERVWVRDFMDHLFDTYFNPQPQAAFNATECRGLVEVFKKGQGTQSDERTPAANYAEAIMQKMGTLRNFERTMVIFPQTENHQKNLMFERRDMATEYKNPKRSANLRACGIGRIASICKYLEHPETQERLQNTIRGVDKILDMMDGDPDLKEITPRALQEKTYVAAHHEYLNAMWQAAFSHGQDILQDYAKRLIADSSDEIDGDDFNGELRDALKDLEKGNFNGFCESKTKL